MLVKLCVDGDAIADREALSLAAYCVEHSEDVTVSTYNVIVAMKYLIALGYAKHGDVTFDLYGVVCGASEYGAIPDESQHDTMYPMIEKTLELQVKRRKVKKVTVASE